jgi:lysyl-tRNA synthetase class 1
MAERMQLIEDCKAWPFREALGLLKRFKNAPPDKGYVLFETGFGASGLPHIGTFGEVARTTMVRQAFETISDLPTRLICFADDMDGLRKVPDNIPNPEMMHQNLGRPVSRIPDPFGSHESFGAHNNARLQAFLDTFGFDYEFYSSSECYASGRFDEALLLVLTNYDSVCEVILPTLGEKRRRTYSPFLPICPQTGRVLQTPIVERDVAAGTITYENEDGKPVVVPVTGGHCKLQWKADWAMRWYALDVDYEMSGKDLIESVKLSAAIEKVLGGQPPEGFIFELFLDENGEKISKSRGNGLTIDEWLRYASPESLSLFMYQNPQRAKRLFFDVIPKTVEEYYQHLSKFEGQSETERLENPVYHIHGGAPPTVDLPVGYSLLLNLVGTANTADKEVLWGFITSYAPGANSTANPELDRLIDYAINYFKDFVAPTKAYRLPDPREAGALTFLLGKLKALPADVDGETIQTAIYDAGKAHDFANLRDWFRALYEILLGQSQGPRMGNFIALYGLERSINLIENVLAGQKAG